MMRLSLVLFPALMLAALGPAAAQDPGTLDKKPLPPLDHPSDPSTPARELFGRETKPAASLRGRSVPTLPVALPARLRCPSMGRPGR